MFEVHDQYNKHNPVFTGTEQECVEYAEALARLRTAWNHGTGPLNPVTVYGPDGLAFSSHWSESHQHHHVIKS